MASKEGKSKKKVSPKQRSEWLTAYLFIGPTFLGLLIFMIIPIFHSFYISFTKWDNLTAPVFIGIDNYIRLFKDSTTLKELANTLIFTFISVPISVVLAVYLADFFNKKIPLNGFFRAAYFIPNITLPAAAAIVWESMFNSKFGMVNGFLATFGIAPVRWFASPALTMGIIILVGVWTTVGYNALILLVGAKNIPSSYYEAAKIDGATESEQFYKITIPLLSPQIFFVTITSCIAAFKMFDAIFIFGKSSSSVRDAIRTLVYGVYERGFLFKEMGYASAESILLLAIVMIFTIIQFVAQKKWVNY